MKKYLAYYLRLSLDDGNISDSNSISNQRQLIKEYIYSSDEFVETQILEFVDDGYSGTNFNRPDIKRLLEAVKKGEISCIIVKDFSRFGRNYLEVSKYIEQVFPYVGVRFIAINDNYDSNNHKGTTAEIDVPVRNIINEMYSKDISKKVKSVLQTKISQGLVVGGRTSFGYKIDNSNRGKVVIDEPAAAVIREIFQFAINGNTPFQIAELLNVKNIPTPATYKQKNGDKMKWHTTVNEGKTIWKYNSVFKILCDERYTGTFIGGKRKSKKVGGKEIKLQPKEEWVRIPNNHPAIITQEQFDIAGKMIHKFPNKNKSKINSYRPLYKKVRCGKCRHLMRYRNEASNPFYVCTNVRYTDEYGCMRERIREKELNEVVMSIFLMQINIFIDKIQLCRMTVNKINKPNISTDNLILELDNEINKLQSGKRKLYERYKNGELNQFLYLKEREMLERELENKTMAREALISQKQNYENIIESGQQISQKFLEFQSATELTKEIADKFIEEVKVYEVDRIEIKFAFKDELEKIMEIIQLKKNYEE